jgi:hypothetical protein
MERVRTIIPVLFCSVLFCPCVPRVVAHSRLYPSTRFRHSGARFRLFVCLAGPREIPPAVGRCWLSTGSTAAACAVPLSPCGSHVPARPAEGGVVVRATAIPNARRIAGRAIRCRCDLPRATRTSQCRSRPTRGRELATWRTQFYFFLGHGVASHLPLFSQPKRNSTSFSFPSRL